MTFRSALILVAAALGLFSGCSRPLVRGTYRTVYPDNLRSRTAAEEANARGVSLARGQDYSQAEEAFLDALRADVGYAAAHSNLGLIRLRQGRFHEAALEFSYAIKLEPRAIEPRLNLARLYETVGWTADALAEYEEAVSLDGGNVQATARLAHLYLQTGRNREDAEPLLRRLAGGDSDEFKNWALAALKVQAGAVSE